MAGPIDYRVGRKVHALRMTMGPTQPHHLAAEGEAGLYSDPNVIGGWIQSKRVKQRAEQ